MSSYMQEKWSTVEGTHAMRDELLDTLTDADMAFNPGGANMTFGALWREMGEIEHSYAQSLKNFTQDFDYRNREAGLDGSVARLKAWLQTLDAEMKATLEGYTDAEWNKPIVRPGFEPSVETQMDIYLQAMLIFFGKASIYVKAMNKPLTDSVRDWIG